MTAACGTWGDSAALASTMLELVDCEMRVAVEQSYGLLLGTGSPFGTALTAVLTIYVALLGYQLIFGRASVTIADLAPRLIGIGVVLALATSWPTYQRLVYDVLTNGPADAARWVSGLNNTPALLRTLDDRTAVLVEVSEAWTKASKNPQPTDERAAANDQKVAAVPALEPLPGPIAAESVTGPRLLTWSAILLLVVSVGPLLATKIVLGILLALGPPFLLLALFALTRGLAFGWLRASAFLAIVPMLSALSTAGGLLLLGPLIDRIAADAIIERFSTVLALELFAGTLLLAGATLLLLRVAQMIASGWVIRFGRTPDHQAPGADQMSGPPQPLGASTMPRADQIAFAMERVAASAPARVDMTAPPPLLIEMSAPAIAARNAETVAGRRIAETGRQGGVRGAIRPLRAGEAS